MPTLMMGGPTGRVGGVACGGGRRGGSGQLSSSSAVPVHGVYIVSGGARQGRTKSNDTIALDE